ncbi:hypothetical protein BJ166DRAFT_513785 [Pestalotiopsis sp. NC0098]|nr:hypothetical protein BJ166DRAFT_513785 [Pestalotiopsis sp. NC0098]
MQCKAEHQRLRRLLLFPFTFLFTCNPSGTFRLERSKHFRVDRHFCDLLASTTTQLFVYKPEHTRTCPELLVVIRDSYRFMISSE